MRYPITLALTAFVLSQAGCSALPSRKVASGLSAPAAKAEETGAVLKPDEKAGVVLAIAQSLEGQGQLKEAEQAYQKCVDSSVGATALHRLAVLSVQQGQNGRGEQYFAAALKKSPDDAPLLTDFAYLKYLQKEFGEAEQLLQRALTIDSHYAHAHANLGMLRSNQQRYDEAVQHYILSGCSEPEARANLALSMALRGELEMARHNYRVALSTQPELQKAQSGLQQVERLMQQSPTAMMLSQRSNPPAPTSTQSHSAMMAGRYLNQQPVAQAAVGRASFNDSTHLHPVVQR